VINQFASTRYRRCMICSLSGRCTVYSRRPPSSNRRETSPYSRNDHLSLGSVRQVPTSRTLPLVVTAAPLRPPSQADVAQPRGAYCQLPDLAARSPIKMEMYAVIKNSAAAAPSYLLAPLRSSSIPLLRTPSPHPATTLLDANTLAFPKHPEWCRWPTQVGVGWEGNSICFGMIGSHST
jgi:hypothetical protein